MMATGEMAADSNLDLIQFASPKAGVAQGNKAASASNSRYNDQENKENNHHHVTYLLDSSFNGGENGVGASDLEVGRRAAAETSSMNGVSTVPAKPSPALLSSITSLLDSTILGNASTTLNDSYYDSIISPLTPSVFNDGGKLNQQQQTPVSTRQQQQQPRETNSGSSETTTSGKLMNETNLDVVDFIEVNNEPLGGGDGQDQEDFWLCDPKSTRQSKQSKQLQMYLRQQQQQQLQQQVLHEKKQNTANTANSNSTTTTTTTTNGAGQRVKNPYKWITEEFEDKNLDKVKRTLLVTLDDIAKGYNRRSRSVSTTRTSFSTYHIPNQQQTPLQQQLHQHQQNIIQNSRYHGNEQPAAFHDNEGGKRQAHNSTRNGANHLPQSKSIESILNESTADVIDSSSNVTHLGNSNGNINTNLNYATMIKRKNSNMSPTQADMNLNDSAYLTTQSDDSNQADYTSTSLGQTQQQQPPAQQAQYEDMLDVQVIAKMQEESLRQSVLNLNKSQENNLNKTVDQLPSHLKRGTYSTATITKRTNSRLSHAPVINFDQEHPSNAVRRDSVSSSDHSSLSSTASNFESPYTSHANVNDIKTRKSPKKITSGLNGGGLPARRTTELVATFLNNKTANSPSLSLAPTNGSSSALNYQTITKATANSVGIKVNSSTRSNTPNRPSVYSVLGNSGTASKQQVDTTRLPTPRTSRSSLGNGYLSAASQTAKSKSPNQINRNYLQQQQQQMMMMMNNNGGGHHGQSTTALNKPPPAPPTGGGNMNGPTSGTRTGRPLMAYGGQRSATTSIISQPNSSNSQQTTSWQLNKLQKQQQQQQALLQQQQQQQLLQQQQQFLQQQQILMQKQRMAVNPSAMTHTTTSHSLASSASINNMSNNSPRSPSSSISASSSINQMAPLNASSPRSRNESRNHSPSSTYSSNSSQQAAHATNTANSNKLMNNIISPSGLLTNGPLGRRIITSPSRMRERSSSPSSSNNGQQQQNNNNGASAYHHQHLTQQLINQLNYGSNGNLPQQQQQQASDSAAKNNPSSPTSARKQVPTRRSFLPQPVQYQSQHQINPSVSPIRSSSKNLASTSSNWKDGCY